MSADQIIDHILHAARMAQAGQFGVLSTGEKLAAALVLNRADWLAEERYTMAEAIERVGSAWVAQIPGAARIMAGEAAA